MSIDIVTGAAVSGTGTWRYTGWLCVACQGYYSLWIAAADGLGFCRCKLKVRVPSCIILVGTKAELSSNG